MKNCCLAIKLLAIKYPDHTFIIAKHPNPTVSNLIEFILSDIPNVQLLKALPCDVFARTLAESKLVMTDSGGIVQEAIFLRKPVVHLRNKSEYEYLFDNYTLVSVGQDINKIIRHTSKILDNDLPKCRKIDDFGDGTAAKRTVSYILGEYYGK